jgi:hypothetical protein
MSQDIIPSENVTLVANVMIEMRENKEKNHKFFLKMFYLFL